MAVKTTSRLKSFAIRYNIVILSALLLCISLFFYLGAEKIRAITNSSNTAAFSTGDIVNVKEAIDGDDLLIEKDGVLTDLRLIGIESFNPTVSDPLLSEYGRICFQYLQSQIVGKQARLVIPEKRIGKKGRLLGSLYLKDDAGAYTVDLGLDLVGKGYSLVYTRYDFSLMDQYLKVETEAREAGAGFWGNDKIAARADSMRKLWDEDKTND